MMIQNFKILGTKSKCIHYGQFVKVFGFIFNHLSTWFGSFLQRCKIFNYVGNGQGTVVIKTKKVEGKIEKQTILSAYLTTT